MYLEQINSPKDVKKLNYEELIALAQEMRETLIQKTSVCGGHLASNLGIVELTIALHYVFDAPTDKIVFDVSHQTYCHKMLTGRKDAFLDAAQYDSVSGYSNPAESEYDLFSLGHSATSIGLACGLVKARDLRGGNENVIAVIGDSALDGGGAFEALNYAAELGSGLIVIVNDNDMSIPENYGALSRQFSRLRETGGTVADNFFQALGFAYHYVPNGHSVMDIISVFQMVKNIDRPVVIHVSTQKGKGYSLAEADPEKWHWARPFKVETGELTSGVPKENYGAIAGAFLLDKIQRDPAVAVVAASTPNCIGFHAENRKRAGKQYIDVGIAEQNAVTLAAGMAKSGAKPVFATNSTFFQRAYDQIAQEICINRCPVTMIVTHGSVFGHSNDTHTGLLDMALLGNIPNLLYLAPANKQEYLAMLDWSIEQREFPVAIRVPWTGVRQADGPVPQKYGEVCYHTQTEGERVAILALGGFFQLGEQTAHLLTERTGITPTLVNPRFITGLDVPTLEGLEEKHSLVVTIEDGILSGGFGARIAQFYAARPVKVLNCGFSMDIPNHFKPRELMEQNRLTPECIVDDIISAISGEER